FVRFDDLIDFYFESDLAADIGSFPLLSFLLVELEDGADRDAVAASIEREVASADVYTPEAMADEDEAMSRSLLGPIIGFLIAVSYISGALVTGIIMFATVDTRRRELGVLKALGYPNGFLTAAVVLEALILVCGALPVGFLLARVIAAGIETGMPLYRIPVMETWPVVRTAAASIVFAVLGALMPVRLIRRLDPSLVFRS
ncbi:MAG TPA: ABC transporter permease, partial [Gammaproteobacteria bacterium]|nr:ABC transporter permease [Gammaproteobacteria bacterium]